MDCRNWHKRNVRTARLIKLNDVMCASGHNYFEVRVKDENGKSLIIIMTGDEAGVFAARVKRCIRDV